MFTKSEKRTVIQGEGALIILRNTTNKWDAARVEVTSPGYSVLKCDNPDCDHIEDVDNSRGHYRHLNMACPECGDNLLTKEDLLLFYRTHIGLALTNRLYNWAMPKLPEWLALKFYSNIRRVEIKTHKKIKIEELSEV